MDSQVSLTSSKSPIACRLDLPPTLRIHKFHNVFHTSLLRAAATDPLPGQHQPPRSRIVLESENAKGRAWMVTNILDSRIKMNQQGKVSLEYYVKWKGYPPSWRPQRDLMPGCEALLYDFHVQHPDKPSPTEVWRRRSSQFFRRGKGGQCHGTTCCTRVDIM